MLVLFCGTLMVQSFFNNNPKYMLMVYNYPASNEEFHDQYYEVMKDVNDRVNVFSFGVLNTTDKRIQVSQTPLYILVKQRNQEIMFVTDNLKKLKDFIINE